VLEERRRALLAGGGYRPRTRVRHVSAALRAYAVMAQSADKGAVRDVDAVERAVARVAADDALADQDIALSTGR
jgi:dihydroxy-acid dehydratase